MTNRFPGVVRDRKHDVPPARPRPIDTMVRETPTRDVRKDALLYVFTDTTVSDYMSVFDDQAIAWAMRPDPNFSVDGRYMIAQPLPPGLDLWRSWLLTVPEAERDLAPYVCRKRLWPGGRGHLAPDVLTTINFPLVRENVRDVLRRNDPDGHYFVPAEFVDWDSGAPIPGTWWHWIVRRRFSVSTDGPRWTRSLPFDSRFSDPRAANELVQNPAARAYFAEIGALGYLTYYFQVAFDRRLFAALKAAGVTGLVERTNDAPGTYPEEMKPYENVGHIP